MLAKLRKLVLYLAVGSTVLLLVQAKGWIDSRNTGERVDEMIKASWLTANETALKLGLDSSFADKVVARDRLVRLQAMIANTKRMKSMDTLRLSYVEEHIAKMNAAIEVDEARQVLERRYDEAKRWPENARRTEAEIRDRLRRTDAETQRLLATIEEAQANYDAANETMKEIWNRLRKAGAILPKP